MTSREQQAAATALRQVLAARRRAQDLLDVGAYVAGSNPKVDAAVAHGDAIDAFLRQPMDEQADPTRSWAHLTELVARMGIS